MSQLGLESREGAHVGPVFGPLVGGVGCEPGAELSLSGGSFIRVRGGGAGGSAVHGLVGEPVRHGVAGP